MNRNHSSNDFNKLMQDPEDLEVFRLYLRENNIEGLLDFYFLCCSVHCSENLEKIVPLVKAIFKRFINRTENIVHSQLSESIRNKLNEHYRTIRNSNQELPNEFYLNLFDDAKSHIYNKLGDAIYQNFLTSSIYRQSLFDQNSYIDPQPQDYSSLPNAEGSPIYGRGSIDETSNIQHEQFKQYVITTDSNNNDKTRETFNNEASSKTSSQQVCLQTEQVEFQKHSEAHTQHSNELLFQQQQQQQQQQSIYNDYSRNNIYNHNNNILNRNRNTVSILETLPENEVESEIESLTSNMSSAKITSVSNQSRFKSSSANLAQSFGTSMESSNHNFNSKTLSRSSKVRPIHHTVRSDSPSTDSTKFYPSDLIDCFLNKAKAQLNTFQINNSMPHPYPPPHPYHVTTNNAVPPSACDSAFQSGTSSDTYSVITTRSNEQSFSKKTVPKQPPPMDSKRFAAISTSNEAQFFEELIRKLNKVKEQLATDIHLQNTLRKADSDSSSSTAIGGLRQRSTMNTINTSGRSQNNEFGKNLRETFKTKPFVYPSTENESQKILDSHCAQVFDSTPNSGTPTNALQAPQQNSYVFNNSYFLRSGGRNTVPATAIRSNGINGQVINEQPISISITVRFEEDDIPYKFRLPGPIVHLSTFKTHVRTFKRGKSFNYFFKRKTNLSEEKESGASFYLELLQHDDTVLPVLEGNKIFAEAKEPARLKP